jgi:hypothetical protein
VTRQQAWEENLVRQRGIAHDVNKQLSDLLRMAHERKDAELEQMTMRAFEMGTALALSFPAGLPKEAASARKRPTTRELAERFGYSFPDDGAVYGPAADAVDEERSEDPSDQA